MAHRSQPPAPCFAFLTRGGKALLVGTALWSGPAAAESWVFGVGMDQSVFGMGTLTTRVVNKKGTDRQTAATLDQPRFRSLRAVVGVDTDTAVDQYLLFRISALQAGLEEQAAYAAHVSSADSGLTWDLGGQLEFPGLTAGPVGLGAFMELGVSRVRIGGSDLEEVAELYEGAQLFNGGAWGAFGGGGLAGTLAIGKDSGVSLVLMGGANYRHIWLAEYSSLTGTQAARASLRIIEPHGALDLRLRI